MIAFNSGRDSPIELLGYVIDPRGGKPRMIDDVFFEYPSWSPDGRRLVFMHQTFEEAGGIYEIAVVNRDGSGMERLTNEAADDGWPQWSPDGKKIVFSSTRDDCRFSTEEDCKYSGDMGEFHTLYVMNADGTEQTRITEVFAAVCRMVARRQIHSVHPVSRRHLHHATRRVRLDIGTYRGCRRLDHPCRLDRLGSPSLRSCTRSRFPIFRCSRSARLLIAAWGDVLGTLRCGPPLLAPSSQRGTPSIMGNARSHPRQRVEQGMHRVSGLPWYVANRSTINRTLRLSLGTLRLSWPSFIS